MTSETRLPAERAQLTLDLAYAFDQPAHDLDIELPVRPLLATDTGLPSIRLASEPEGRFDPPVVNGNGGVVDRLRLTGPALRLRLNASFDHPVDPDAALPALAPTPADLVLEGLLDPTCSTPWPQDLADLRQSWRYSDEPRYQRQALQEIAQRRIGSCEAIARLAIEIIRARNIPARFVGGYRLAGLSGDTRPVRRHAWIAIWEGSQWRMLDPLAPSAPGQCLIPTAFASRLPEIATIQGSFKGAGTARLTVSAHAQRYRSSVERSHSP